MTDPADVVYAVREYTQGTYRLYERLSPSQRSSVRAHFESGGENVPRTTGGMLDQIHQACGDRMVDGQWRAGARMALADPGMAGRLAIHLRALVACAPYMVSEAPSVEVTLSGGPQRFPVGTDAGWRELFRAVRDDADRGLREHVKGVSE